MTFDNLGEKFDATFFDVGSEARRAGADHSKRKKLGFNVIGYISSNLGMAVTTRHYIRLLLECGHDIAVLDISPGYQRGSPDCTYEKLTVACAADLPYSINLVVLNIADLPQLFLDPIDGLFRNGRINVVLPWWELTTFPDRWIEALRLFDVVLAGSDFIQHTIAFSVPGTRVVRALQPLYLPAEPIRPDRALFGLPDGAVLFLSSFEPLSGVQRKNPFAAISAFQLAFPDRSDTRARIVVKMSFQDNARDRVLRPFVERLEALCAADPRIIIINRLLSYNEVLQLYATCDVFVSLHRSEGLGLGPLEAMRLGRPAIATGWSGNLSYMNQANACLVSYGFTEAGGDGHYEPRFLGKVGFWAEPDIAEASSYMVKLVESPELRINIGKRARESTGRLQMHAEEATFVGEIQAIVDQIEPIKTSAKPRYQDVSLLSEAELKYKSLLKVKPTSLSLMRQLRAVADRHVFWRFR